MSSSRYRILSLFLLLIIFVSSPVFAGTTGKIAGRIVDRETGEPLPGVNVIVKETTLGSTTDIDGYYVVLQVPPGVHSVIASMVGYATITINNVNVHIDQTATVDISMTSEVIEIGDITVVAERNLVKQDVSTSVTSVRPNEIEVLPVTSINDIVGLQAGIEEGLVVRGGEADELLFQIDGVTLRDPRNNQPISSVALSSIQELSIEKGGFNAEYGQVRSGIINIVSREGSPSEYFGAVQLKYSPAQKKHFGISVYDPNSMWNRPYLDPAVAWTGTAGEPFTDLNGNGRWDSSEVFTDIDNNNSWTPGWDEYTRRQYPSFEGWYSVSQRTLQDEDPANDLSPAAAQRLWMWEHRRRPSIEPDYNVDASFGGPVPFISKSLGNLRFFASYRFEREMLLIPLSRDDYRENNFSLKINSDLTSTMKLTLSGTTGITRNVALNASDRQFDDPAWGINGVQFWSPTTYIRTPYQIAEVTNEQRAARIFTNSWYSTANVVHKTLAGKITDFLNQTTFYEIGLEWVNRNYETGPIGDRDTTKRYEIVPGYFVDEAPFGYSIDPAAGIGDPGMFFGGHSSTIRDHSKLNSFVIKGDLSSQITNEHLIKTGIEFSYFDLNLDYGIVQPAFGTDNIVKEIWNPYRLSAYIQDKIEAFGFIANLGVRMDLSNPNTEWADVDPFDETYFSSEYLTNPDYPKKKAEIDIAFSPRLGISHPITENSKLYFNYGHFKEMPAYEEIFRLGRGIGGNMLNYGDPNLSQARTISYELGYDHVLFDIYILQLAAFYNDISNQQAYTQFVSDRKSIGYFQANNDSYEDIRGFELSFKKSEGDWIRGFLNFTYQVSTQGAFGKQTINEDPAEQKIIDQNTSVLYQQKPVPQPRINANITFLTPEDFGPELVGINLFGNWALNILAQWRAGEYLTYNPLQLTDVINNVQVTDYYNIDLRINKTFNFDLLNVMFFMEVTNLLNTKRLSGASFYNTFDQQYYFESLHLPKNRAYTNIPGDDRIGDVRKEGVSFQPIEQVLNVNSLVTSNIKPSVIYYESSTQRYMNYVDGNWLEVDGGRMQQILDDKAYIDMPNNSSFDFLNPRQIFFGINLSFKL
jgi:outer membrane receptor protein involved in Fe transport